MQSQMAVAVPNRVITGECLARSKGDRKPVGRRRVFVQTETGCVLGLELYRGDSANSVKRRLQVAFNYPADESSLTFGDLVLKNDLSAIRGDVSLLLTRNSMHRSSSTPCLSLSVHDLLQKDLSRPIEILGRPSRCARMKQLVKEAVKAIRSGVDPIPVNSGLGGAYYFRNIRGEKVAIVKPTDEEPFAPNNPKGFVGKVLGQPGLIRSVRVGETGFREVAAYLLDYDNFANVPPTALVKITHSIFHVNDGVNNKNHRILEGMHQVSSKIASFQQFIPHDFDANDHGNSSFPVTSVHRIGILDIRIFNTDRHAGNILVRKIVSGLGRFGGKMELIPIDHGLCLPENLEDPYFEWIHWPQASVPFSDDELEYIASLDPAKDCDMLRKELPMIRDACLRVLILCTIFLKEAAAFGLCLAEIGEMMSREFKGMEEGPSELEAICLEARKLLIEREKLSFKSDHEAEDDVQFQIDCNEADENKMCNSMAIIGCNEITSRNHLSKLEEALEEEEEEDGNSEGINIGKDSGFSYVHEQLSSVSMLSASLKNVGLTGKASDYQIVSLEQIRSVGNAEKNGADLKTGSSRSADEQLFSGTSFVKLADLSEVEWGDFLGILRELLPEAFIGYRSLATGPLQKQRLGTSCRF